MTFDVVYGGGSIQGVCWQCHTTVWKAV